MNEIKLKENMRKQIEEHVKLYFGMAVNRMKMEDNIQISFKSLMLSIVKLWTFYIDFNFVPF